ncbi:MAG: branched-chain amino acid ABC transporter permease [Acidimicrobiia bacterium]
MPPLQLYVSILEAATFGALVALAYTLVLASCRIFNFAIGAYAMVAAMVTVRVQEWGWSIPLGVVVGILIAGALGFASNYLVLRPIEASRLKAVENTIVVAFAALLFTLSQGVGWLFGREIARPKPLVAGPPIEWGGAFIPRQTIVALVITAVVFIAAGVWFRFARSGRLFRAVGDNEDAARQIGIPIERMRSLGFILGGLIGGLAGMLYAPKAGVSFDSSLAWSLFGFLVLVIGGTGKLIAPIIGGIILASLNVLVPYYFGGGNVNYVIFLTAVAFFLLSPEGIFRVRVRV